MKEPCLKTIANDLFNAVYKASVEYYEMAESKGLINGNGHHMAQKAAAECTKMLCDRERK